MAFPQGRRRVETGSVPSGAHGATNKEHHACARRRVGEAAGSPLRISTRRERRWKPFSTSYLLDRHAFGQVPWLIHIRAAQHGDMIRQELQWNREQNWRE